MVFCLLWEIMSICQVDFDADAFAAREQLEVVTRDIAIVMSEDDSGESDWTG